jgi:hypothetical protein
MSKTADGLGGSSKTLSGISNNTGAQGPPGIQGVPGPAGKE